jgi:membrane protease YdiL (CAAX protease family)
MRNFAVGYLVLLATWWATLLAVWVSVTGEAAGQLNAAELSAALGAMPVVLLLVLFLILYTPFRKSLLVFAALAYALGGWLALQDSAAAPAVVNLVAEQTGVADATGQAALVSVSTSVWPVFSTIVATLGAAYSLVWVIRSGAIKSRERKVTELPDDDLWRETSAG